MDIFRGLLPPASVDDFIPALVRAYLSAYEDASARYDRDVGCDSNTYGTDVWRFSWYRLDQELEPIPGVRTTRADSSFAILVGDIVIRSYRGGADEKYNIDEFDFGAGSRIRREIPWQNYEQLTLFSEVSELALERRLHLTIVHTGNPSLGCTGVWVGLAMPYQWEWVEPLYEPEGLQAAPPRPQDSRLSPNRKSRISGSTFWTRTPTKRTRLIWSSSTTPTRMRLMRTRTQCECG